MRASGPVEVLVEVPVVGTDFYVERASERGRVQVVHGKVQVHSEAGVSFLVGGQASWFVDGALRERVRASSGAARLQPARLDWRRQSQSGDYEAAYRLLARGADVPDD